MTRPKLPVDSDSMIDTLFIIRAMVVSLSVFVDRMWFGNHNSLLTSFSITEKSSQLHFSLPLSFVSTGNRPVLRLQ